MKKTHLLLVEDEANLGEVMVELLVDEGYRVDLADTAEKALMLLEAADGNLPDAILTDIRLPGMSGIEFIQINPVWQSIPLVCLSASSTPEMESFLQNQTNINFVPRPFDIERFLHVVARITASS